MAGDLLDIVLPALSGLGEERIAFVETDNHPVSHAALRARIAAAGAALDAAGLRPGVAVQLQADFGVAGTAFLLALWQRRAIVAPVAPGSLEKAAEFAQVGRVEWIVEAESGRIGPGPQRSDHPLYDRLRAAGAPGLVIFSSGTTGVSKGAVHDAGRLLGKFRAPGKDHVTAAFLLFDHIAGIDTLLYALAQGSALVCLPDRSPDTVAACIARHRVEVLPTAPSFLNLLLLSGAADRHDLSSLRIITWGAEMMPQPLLERVAERFPGVRIVQKYGTSEIGALRARSAGDRSRWLEIGGEGTEWRVAEGLLEIRTPTAMLGYLNAPSPFTEDGWYQTGDRVEVDGPRIRFLGRDSDVISVGGQKVFPAEVEAALAEVPGVAEAAVFGRAHPILGGMVCARLRPADPGLSAAELRVRVRQTLAGRIEPYKIPQRIEVTDEPLVTERFKQRR